MVSFYIKCNKLAFYVIIILLYFSEVLYKCTLNIFKCTSLSHFFENTDETRWNTQKSRDDSVNMA